MRGPLFCLAFAAVALFVSSGCGPATATLTGEVTIDGRPIERGFITISPADDIQAPPALAEFTNGKYEIKTVVGKKFVTISAQRVVDRRKQSEAPDSPLIEITEEVLPERYNVKSDLTIELKPGANVKDWALDSKDKKP